MLCTARKAFAASQPTIRCGHFAKAGSLWNETPDNRARLPFAQIQPLYEGVHVTVPKDAKNRLLLKSIHAPLTHKMADHGNHEPQRGSANGLPDPVAQGLVEFGDQLVKGPAAFRRGVLL